MSTRGTWWWTALLGLLVACTGTTPPTHEAPSVVVPAVPDDEMPRGAVAARARPSAPAATTDEDDVARRQCVEHLQRYDSPRMHRWRPERRAAIAACAEDDPAGCRALAWHASGACRGSLLNFACGTGDDFACLARALSLEVAIDRTYALSTVDHPWAAFFADPTDAAIPPCDTEACADDLQHLRWVAPPRDVALLLLADRACAVDDDACLLAFDRTPRFADHAALPAHLRSPLAFCQRRPRLCRRLAQQPRSALLDDVLCAMGDGRLCARAIAVHMRAMAGAMTGERFGDAALTGCRLGDAAACLFLGPERAKQEGLPVVTCRRRPRDCARALADADRAMGLGLELHPDHVLSLAGPACRRLADPLACRALVEYQRELPAKVRRAHLRRACPPAGRADGEGCALLASDLAQEGRLVRATQIRRRACEELHSSHACYELGQPLLLDPDPREVARAERYLDEACWDQHGYACQALSRHYTARGDEARSQLYVELANSIGC